MGSHDTGDGVVERLGAALRRREETVAVAEGCTGGRVCALLTGQAGASAYFDRGVVPYAYDANRELLGVARETLDDHGVVSGPVARELAQRVRDLAKTTWGLSTAGLAGPSGGSEAKPVGTVFIGVAYAGPWGSGRSYAVVREHRFSGSRVEVQDRMARRAVEELLAEIEQAD